MAIKSLAVKYRPKTFDDVVEQSSIKIILKQQLESGTVKHAYLFVGGAGTGKTTCARIFAAEINRGVGLPIEMDAASNSGVDDVREIIRQAKTRSLDSEYKVFIIDECHAISNTGWQAFLKLLEEPPAKSIFIFCTTNPEKIPKTILSRVQRYDFQRISHDGIVRRLNMILAIENSDNLYNNAGDFPPITFEDAALEYIAKLADGGMRDAITFMDKCLSLSSQLTLENVVTALGATNYDTMFTLAHALFDGRSVDALNIVNDIHASGKDLKQFAKSFMYFVLDLAKFSVGCPMTSLSIPNTKSYSEQIIGISDDEFGFCRSLLPRLSELNVDIRFSQSPKCDIEAAFLMICLLRG